ncbi:MAG TPA: hypothetical protein PKD95_03680, partial [Candidatus Paceibacterota bacterium]|nr:hypothetical protein [Candidatus Paceibacterota bacterium]
PTASEMGELKTESEDFVLPDEPMTTAGNQGFTLTAEQRQAVISLGVPEASVPTTVSYEMEQCFIGVLGEARVEEIKAGAMPGGLEFIRAQACI